MGLNDKNTFDIWLMRITSISQVIIMVLALLGFFHTVVPMYQDQLIKEEYSRIRIDNLEAQDKLRATLSEIKTLKEENVDIVKQHGSVKESLERASLELKDVQKKFAVIQKDLSTNSNSLRAVKKQLLETKGSLVEIQIVHLLRATEWMTITGNQTEGCDRVGTLNQPPHCTPFKYIDVALNNILKPTAVDPSGRTLIVPANVRQNFVDVARELLSENQLLLMKKTDYNKDTDAMSWFFKQLQKKF